MTIVNPINTELDHAFSDRVSAFLLRATAILDPFSLDDVNGYGTTIDIGKAGPTRVSMHRFCWCDGEDCAWCNGHESDIEDDDDKEALLAAWRGHGFVEGYGAPNFRFSSGDLSVSVWWYKYIGRGMETDLDPSRLEELERRFTAWSSLARLEIAASSLDAWLTPETTGLDATTARLMRESFLARLREMENPDLRGAGSPETVMAEIRSAIDALRRQAWQADQARLMEKHLDTAGIRRESPDFPEELFGPMTSAYRLERVLFHQGTFPSEIEDLDEVDEEALEPADDGVPF